MAATNAVDIWIASESNSYYEHTANTEADISSILEGDIQHKDAQYNGTPA